MYCFSQITWSSFKLGHSLIFSFYFMITLCTLRSPLLISEEFFISYDMVSPRLYPYPIPFISTISYILYHLGFLALYYKTITNWLCLFSAIIVFRLSTCLFLFSSFCCHHYQFLLFNNIILLFVYVVSLLLCWPLWIHLVDIRSLCRYELYYTCMLSCWVTEVRFVKIVHICNCHLK